MGSRAQAQWLWCTGLVAPRHVGSSWTRARTRVPCIGRWILNHGATRQAPKCQLLNMACQTLPDLVSAHLSLTPPQLASSLCALLPQHPGHHADMALYLPNFCLKSLASCLPLLLHCLLTLDQLSITAFEPSSPFCHRARPHKITLFFF